MENYCMTNVFRTPYLNARLKNCAFPGAGENNKSGYMCAVGRGEGGGGGGGEERAKVCSIQQRTPDTFITLGNGKSVVQLSDKTLEGTQQSCTTIVRIQGNLQSKSHSYDEEVNCYSRCAITILH